MTNLTRQNENLRTNFESRSQLGMGPRSNEHELLEALFPEQYIAEYETRTNKVTCFQTRSTRGIPDLKRIVREDKISFFGHPRSKTYPERFEISLAQLPLNAETLTMLATSYDNFRKFMEQEKLAGIYAILIGETRLPGNRQGYTVEIIPFKRKK